MTEPSSASTPTRSASATATADQLDRVAELRRRRGATAPAVGGTAANTSQRTRRRRRHVAQGGRIIAAGLGATTMFGIVTAFGLDNPVIGSVEPTDPTVPQTPVEPVVTPTAPPVQIVVHRVPSTAPAPVVDTTGSSEVAITDAASAAVVPDAPVQLTANPVVQTVTVAAPSQPQQSSQPQASSAPAAAPTPAPATTKGSG